MQVKRNNLNTYYFGDWSFDYSKSALHQNSTNTSVRLEPKVSELLRLLLNSNREVVSREELIDTLWSNTVVSEDTLARTISRLRSALSDSAKTPKYIETIPKRGYRFLVPLVENQSVKMQPNKHLYLGVSFVGILLVASVVYFFNVLTVQQSMNEGLSRAESLYMRFNEQDNEAAIALYEKVLEIEPNNSRAKAGIANAIIQRVVRWPRKEFKTKESGISLSQALSSGQLETPEAKLMLERARLLAEKAVRQAPTDVQVLKALGFAYSAEGNLARAIELYQQAIDIDPNAWRSLINLGEIYALDGQHKNSLNTFVKAFEAMQTKFNEEPQHIDPWQFQLGNVIASKYADMGDLENTQLWAKKVLALVPFERKASTLLIESLIRSNNVNEAQITCETYAKKLQPLAICQNL